MLHNRPWYKKWWGIILAILIWPIFLLWYLWAKSNIGNTVKVAGTVAIGVVSLIALGAVLSNVPAPTVNTQQAATVTKPKTTTAVSKTTTKPAVQAPTVSLATLNAQSVSILTPVLTDFEQQMSQGQADATQSNAGDVSSDFHSWETAEQDKQNVANNKEQVTAYNKADNAYYNAHQTVPDALSNWDSDAGNLPGDITEWANAEELVADDNVTGSSSLSTDKQTAATDMQTYQSDLAKAQADIKQF